MKPGHYLATKPIALACPFEAREMPIAANFDVLQTGPGYVLIRYEGIRVWKPVAHLEGRAVRTAGKVVAEDGYRMMPPPIITEPTIVLEWTPQLRRAPQPVT
jgi:hypothetical protein